MTALAERARRSADAIREHQRKAVVLDSAIDRLQVDDRRISQEMISLRQSSDSLNDMLAILTEEYVTMGRRLFQQQLLTPVASALLMPREQQRLALKQKLFQILTRKQSARARELRKLQAELSSQESLLDTRRNQQLTEIAATRTEIGEAVLKQEEEARLLSHTEEQKSALKKFIERKSAEANLISGMIARLAAAEKRQLELERQRRRKGEQARQRLLRMEENARKERREKEQTRGAQTRKGSGAAASKPVSKGGNRPPEPSPPVRRERRDRPVDFSWPTAGRRIVQAYGERLNPHTNTVTLNPGINIEAAKGTQVTASEDGTVSLVSWLPGYGTIVIVEHDGGYRSVYANLAHASVSRGAEVRAGEKIGVVGRSIEGEFLHFELWKEETRLNPASMLK